MPPVELYLNGFAYFSDGRSVRTIYAKIEMTDRAENWFKLLTMQMGIKLQNYVPHITVARNIPVTAFNKLWPNFESRDFKHRFIVNGLTVLHRDTFAEDSQWKVFRELHFGNKLLAF